MCCSEPFFSHCIENIDISPENSSIGDQNLNSLNRSNKETYRFTELKTFRFKNPKNLLMGHLNINSLRNKFESIKPIISPKFDIYLVSEAKLDKSFPNNQFSISGYRMFRQDRNCFGGGLCIYVKENIASILHPKICRKIFQDNLDSYENRTLLGDFNITPEDKNLQHFPDTFSLEHLINEPTCFKGIPSCIDLIITNRKSYFKNTCVAVAGISHFHKLTAVSLRSLILRAPPKIKTYRSYKTFDDNRFNEDLKSKLDSIEKLDYPLFESIFIDVLNTHTPKKCEQIITNL